MFSHGQVDIRVAEHDVEMRKQFDQFPQIFKVSQSLLVDSCN